MPEMMQDLMEQQPDQSLPIAADSGNLGNVSTQPSGFTINAQEIEDAIEQHMDEKQRKNLDRVLDTGHELLFGKETHYKMMDGMEDSKDIAKDIGEGTFHLMMILYKESNETLPGDIIIPAGIILLANTAEFVAQSGVPITDDDFEEAAHTFTTLTMNTLDPSFRDRVKQQMPNDMGAANMQQMPNNMQQQDQQPPPLMQQGGGLLDSTARA